MLRQLMLVSVVAGGLATAGWASAPNAGPAGGRHPGADTPLGRLISGGVGRALVLRSELNLTADQKHQIRQVLVNHRAEIAATAKLVHEKRTALRDAVLAGKDEAQIRAAADELGKVIGDTAVKASKLRNTVAPILTDEQRQLIGKFFADQDAAVEKFLERASAGS